MPKAVITRKGPRNAELIEQMLAKNGVYLVTVHEQCIVKVVPVPKEGLESATPARNDIVQTFLSVYDITPVQARALIDAGFTTIEDVNKAADEALLAVDGIGKATVEKLRGGD